MSENKLKQDLLNEELDLLKKSVDTLEKSIAKCIKIVGKSEYSFEEMESFDSLSSKFGRTPDLFIQKVLRTIWVLLHEPYLPFIDFLNQAEKIDLIKSADQMLEIRDLRNQIAHEYIPEAISKLIPEVINLSGNLLVNIDTTNSFIKERNWLP